MNRIKLKQFIREYTKIEKKFVKNKDIHQGFRPRYELLFGTLIRYRLENKRGLDIGIYPGYFTYCLKNLGYNIEGVDVHPERITKQISQKLTIKKCDIEIESLPYKDKSFDYIIFTAVLEHIRINPIAVLKEIRRILKPGGKLFLQTPNLGFWSRRIRVLFGKGFDRSPYQVYKKIEEIGHAGHIRVYQMHELVEIMRKTGFKIKKKSWIHNFRFPKKFRHIIDFLFGIYPQFRSNLEVVGEK